MVQCIALVPGVSRSGATISAGLLLGLDRVASTRLAFFLGIPALVAAGALELRSSLEGSVGLGPVLVGTVVSFVVAYASIAWLPALRGDPLDRGLRARTASRSARSSWACSGSADPAGPAAGPPQQRPQRPEQQDDQGAGQRAHRVGHDVPVGRGAAGQPGLEHLDGQRQRPERDDHPGGVPAQQQGAGRPKGTKSRTLASPSASSSDNRPSPSRAVRSPA
jgi:hypothetical protein